MIASRVCSVVTNKVLLLLLLSCNLIWKAAALLTNFSRISIAVSGGNDVGFNKLIWKKIILEIKN